MDEKGQREFAKRFLEGAFSALGALLGTKFRYAAGAPAEARAAAVASWSVRYPVWLHAHIERGGTAALLLTGGSAAALSARVGGEDPARKSGVTADDSAVLQELCETMIGGGLSGLGELIWPDASIESAGFSIGENAAALTAALGTGLTGVEVSFQDFGGHCNAVLVYSAELAQRAVGGRVSMDEEPLVSKQEVNDILQDFTPDDETDHARVNGGAVPDNLEVVMDIELVATARLGKVEVPIAQVLNYGPGSIIELGHVVDEPIELLVNGKLIARGDVVVVDERFGLRITEIVSPRERIESLH